MPKQVVKWGKQYLLVHHPATDRVGEWWESTPYSDRRVGLTDAANTEIRQEWLNANRDEQIQVDGKVGPETIEAYKRYQEFLGVKVDGIWGPDTEEAHGKYYASTRRVTREPNVEVVWTRQGENPRPAYEDPEGWVQIGLDIDKVDLEDRLRYDDDSISARTFYTDKLTRHQINEMIRTLKRARNAAYGSDE